MFSHSHHGDADHDDDHHFDHLVPYLRFGVAALIVLAAIAAACIVMIPAGQAGVITRFGNPVRVVTQPGLAWKLPAPIAASLKAWIARLPCWSNGASSGAAMRSPSNIHGR